MRTLPIFAVLLGIAGLVPFVAGTAGALNGDAEISRIALLGLASYGAVILAFLGGVHWGLALQDGVAQTARTQRLRYGLGVVPSLIGWAGLLVVFVGLVKTGLLVETAGFIATTIVEARASQAGLLPRPYMAMRWVLSVVVILCLVSVCLVLSLGGRVTL